MQPVRDFSILLHFTQSVWTSLNDSTDSKPVKPVFSDGLGHGDREWLERRLSAAGRSGHPAAAGIGSPGSDRGDGDGADFRSVQSSPDHSPRLESWWIWSKLRKLFLLHSIKFGIHLRFGFSLKDAIFIAIYPLCNKDNFTLSNT